MSRGPYPEGAPAPAPGFRAAGPAGSAPEVLGELGPNWSPQGKAAEKGGGYKVEMVGWGLGSLRQDGVPVGR